MSDAKPTLIVRKSKTARKRTLEDVDGEHEQQDAKRAATEDAVESDHESEEENASQMEHDDDEQHASDEEAGNEGGGGEEEEEEEEDDGVVSAGTSTNNPNPTAPAPVERLSLYHQPCTKKWTWMDQLQEKTIEADWHSGPIAVHGDELDGDAKLRKSYYFMYKYNPRKPFMKQPKTQTVQLAPMFVTYAKMSGYGSRKFKAKEVYDCEYIVSLSPRVPRNVYGQSVTVYDQAKNEFRTLKVDKDGMSEELQQIERAAMLCYNGLVRLHIKELRKMFEMPQYKTSPKEKQRAFVLDDMKLTISGAGTVYTSAHEDYAQYSSHELQETFEEKLFDEWLAHASTAFGTHKKDYSDDKGSNGDAGSNIPDIPFGFDIGAASDTRLSINIFGDAGDAVVERDDSDMQEQSDEVPWYKQNEQGNYGGPFPSLFVKRNMYFGKLANMKFEHTPDEPGTVPYFGAFDSYQKSNHKIPEELMETLDAHSVKQFKHCVNVHDETVNIGRRNFVQTVYSDPFFRPLTQVAGMSMLEADLKHALVSRGSIVSVGVENMRKQYPADQIDSYGTVCSLRTEVALVAVAVPGEKEREFLSDPKAKMKDLSDEEKKEIKAPVTELHLVCDATY